LRVEPATQYETNLGGDASRFDETIVSPSFSVPE
jgi:hypothetical protein